MSSRMTMHGGIMRQISLLAKNFLPVDDEVVGVLLSGHAVPANGDELRDPYVGPDGGAREGQVSEYAPTSPLRAALLCK